VFLADATEISPGKSRLLAMDHTHCFTCGRDLDGRVARIDWVTDDRLYGLFPPFRPLVREEAVLAAIDRLQEIKEPFVAGVVNSIPSDWEVGPEARAALTELIVRRAAEVADRVLAKIGQACWPGQLFDREE
jgi:hypothetical protein